MAAETLAAGFLERQGMVIITRNWRRRCGEIDLIARDGATLVFVEVRLRRSQAFGGAAASVTSAKQRRIVAAAQLYLQQLPRTPACRFDVVSLDGLAAERIEWHRDAFGV